MNVIVSPDVADIVIPGVIVRHGVTVHAHDARLDGPLASAAESLRTATGLEEATAATRAMYKRCGIDPTKTRPSSEALLRRVRKGDPLPRVNGLVDIINWCSAETQIAYGLYDLARVQPPVTLRLGAPGEGYDGIRKDRVNVEGRLTLADAARPVRQSDIGLGADDDDAGDDRGAGRAVRARGACRARMASGPWR